MVVVRQLNEQVLQLETQVVRYLKNCRVRTAALDCMLRLQLQAIESYQDSALSVCETWVVLPSPWWPINSLVAVRVAFAIAAESISWGEAGGYTCGRCAWFPREVMRESIQLQPGAAALGDLLLQ